MIKFQPAKSEKVVISIRIENYKLEEIDKIASKIDISRNELINQSLDYSINNLEFKNIKKEKQSKKYYYLSDTILIRLAIIYL